MKKKIIISEKQFELLKEFGSSNGRVTVDATDKVKTLGADAGLKQTANDAAANGLSKDNMALAVDGDTIQEGFGDYALAAPHRNKLYGMIEDGEFDGKTIALQLLDYMSDDDVKDFCRVYEYDIFDDEDDEMYECVVTKKELKEAQKKKLNKNSKRMSKKDFLSGK